MKQPRDLSAEELIRTLRQLAYQPTRQKGSHVRLTTIENADHFQLTRDDLLQQLFDLS